MGQSYDGPFTDDESSGVKEFGRYSYATLEYSSLVAVSVLKRGGDTTVKGAKFVAAPVQKSYKVIKKGTGKVVHPLKKLGGPARKMVSPFTWTAGRIGSILSRGFPVHLDPKTVTSLDGSLRRIEERLARLEEKGIYLAGGAPPPSPNDFKEKPDQKKNMVLRAVLEDSKQLLEGDE